MNASKTLSTRVVTVSESTGSSGMVRRGWAMRASVGCPRRGSMRRPHDRRVAGRVLTETGRLCGRVMKAAEHPDYQAEKEYLGGVLEAAGAAVHDLDTRDWRPAMLSDEETALVLRGWADKRRATLAQLLERPYFGRF